MRWNELVELRRKGGRFFVFLRDINGRKKRIEGSLKLFSEALEEAPNGVQIADLDGYIIYSNKAVEEIYGFSPSEYKGKHVNEMNVDPEFASSVILPSIKETGRWAGELMVKHKDGHAFPIWLTISLVKDSKGEPIASVGIISDITERKQMEEKLRRAHDELELRVQERTSELAKANEALQAEIIERKKIEGALRDRESKLSAMINGFDGLIYICSPDYRVEFMNETLIKRSGSEAIGEFCYKVLHNRDSICPWCVNDRVFRGESVRWEVQSPKDSRWYYVVNTPIYHQNGSISKQAMILDITEHKQAEEKIRELAALIDNAHDAIAVCDLEHRFTYWNKGSERLYGWMAEEITGKKADDLLYNEESSSLIEAKKNVIAVGEWAGELRQRTKDGRKIAVESHWTLVRDDLGNPKSILIINTDITEKKRLEAQFLRAQRMESIGTLASGIAHDINNVLSPIILSLQLLKEKFTDDEIQKLINIMERSAQRGASLIKQIQSFARGLEGERMVLQVAHIISEIRQIVKETFPKSIEVKTNVQNDLFTISGDATQLHQVLMNLCVNARDAMPDGGVLSISAENFFIDENYTRMNSEANVGSYIVITVADTGTGIPPEILDRIFEPFFTTKEFGKGTGLGLSTALGIVKSHGGFINVYSEVGKGTAFKVYLPAVKTNEPQKAKERNKLLAGHGEYILVVDDEAQVREITRATLETYGYRVHTARNGAEALALYEKNKEVIRVVLMDMMMPVMDGETSIRKIRRINPQVKIIAVSGLVEKDITATHAQAFLPKPYTAEKLLKTIHKVLSAR